MRNLPILIGDKIPEDDSNWYSFLLLIKICQIAISPEHSRDTIPYLRILVEEKLQLLQKLDPGSTINPKCTIWYIILHKLNDMDHLSISGQCVMRQSSASLKEHHVEEISKIL